MPWNWQLPDWPKFYYDPKEMIQLEKRFLLGLGNASAFLKSIDPAERNRFIVEILSVEGEKSSKIEGELLERESIQSSIKKHFGLKPNRQKDGKKERGMAELLCDVYETYNQDLTHEMFWKWHSMLFQGMTEIDERGIYRSHPEPMQIVSNRYDSPRVYFEAPPSEKIFDEMAQYIDWFNASKSSESSLGRAAIAHLYFENIHPFEDGNGRIGRILVEKVLSQAIEQPILIAVSKVIDKRKKEYYDALGICNRSLDAQQWVLFFGEVILQAQEDSICLLQFLIQKSKMFSSLLGKINERQEKVLLRIFSEGPEGFKGGLSAENYIAITKTSRATATRDLVDLVQKGALRKTGELRHTRYWLNLEG